MGACVLLGTARRLTEGDEVNIRVECELDVERGQPRKGGAEGMAGDDDLCVGREAQPRESIMDGIAKLHRAAEALCGNLCAAQGKGWGVTCLYWFKNPEWTESLVPPYGQADGTAFRSAKASLERSASIDVSVPARSHGRTRPLPLAQCMPACRTRILHLVGRSSRLPEPTRRRIGKARRPALHTLRTAEGQEDYAVDLAHEGVAPQVGPVVDIGACYVLHAGDADW